MNDPNNPRDTDDPGRRTTLKTLLAGGGIFTLTAPPSQWVKPVVDTVVLPTHAQTSPEDEGRNGFRVEDTMGRAPGLLDHLFRTAYASETVVVPAGFLCIESTGEETYEASYSFGGQVATGSVLFDDCVSLQCGSSGVNLIVMGKNGDGSFDFELHPPDTLCSDRFSSPVMGTTDSPCNVKSKDCDV